MEPITLYRYEGVAYASTNRCAVVLHEYEVLKQTKCGQWISLCGELRRFVRFDTRKRFAHETKEAALVSFIARKTRQIDILSRQLSNAKSWVRIAADREQDDISDLAW